MAMESVSKRERIEKTRQRVDVSVEKDEKRGHEPGPEFTTGARSRHHVEEVMSRILDKPRTNTKKFALGDADQENGGTCDRWH
jgi:hypothetical protein